MSLPDSNPSKRPQATMHLDGCHFFAWVFENAQGDHELTWYERNGTDLEVHADSSACDRCEALLGGAVPRQASQTIELPEGAKEAFVAVLVAIGQLDEETP